MVIRKIIQTELLFLSVLALHFFPVSGLPVIGELLQAVLWGVFVFFALLYVPGRWRSWIFFGSGELTGFERFMCSFALSLAFVVFVSLYLTLAGGTIDTWYGVVISFVTVVMGILVLLFLGKWRELETVA